jgi:hypothetical protein
LEHLHNSQHRQFIVPPHNNPSIRAWLPTEAEAEAVAVFADRWICVLNPEVVVVGYKPISM